MLAQVTRLSRHAVAQLVECRTRLPPLEPGPVNGPDRLTRWRPRSLDLRDISSSATRSRRYLISEGRTTAHKSDKNSGSATSDTKPSSLFYLETGYSIFAKRLSRPFPPPFVSLPSGSFSDPLTTHNPSSVPRSARRPMVNGQLVRGITNGDDAIIIGADQRFIAVNDGVGAWAQKERGHAALWSRLIAHFWDVEVEKSLGKDGDTHADEAATLDEVDPVKSLETAFDATKKATKGTLKRDPEQEVYSESEEGESEDGSSPGGTPSSSSKDSSEAKDSSKNDILGTTTASSALLYHKGGASGSTPVILATTLGDCKVLVIRPSPSASPSSTPSDSDTDSESTGGTILYHSKEQWHWFDCPRQLGTNSPDTPTGNAVCDTIEDIEVGDVVAVLSDGVTDNLWEHEICKIICESIRQWHDSAASSAPDDDGGKSKPNGNGSEDGDAKDGVVYVARRLMNAAREVAMDPNAESPYMERAFDEGIAAEGGKLDDISVVIGIVRKRE
ncbi:hypothetical protein PV04_08813 [Phialophora macrospora]|uniref:Protein phosphatase n=1 Tax=Phialophora macrospora TaxID=1851006 RepID=A0A0D2CFC4_9EURO|nr:hypothetical protein PV04_08813 [Phialophora macrospora]